MNPSIFLHPRRLAALLTALVTLLGGQALLSAPAGRSHPTSLVRSARKLAPAALKPSGKQLSGKQSGPARAAQERAARFRSVKALENYIDDLKAKSRARRADKGDADKEANPAKEQAGRANEEEEAGTDFLEAYLYHLQMRAFPSDTVNWSAYPRAVLQRDRMTPALLGVARGSAPRASGYSGPAAAGWQFVGPTNLSVPYRIYYGQGAINGRINAIAFDPTTSSVFYIATASGGLWKTTNGGVNWTPLTDRGLTLQTSAIAVDPTNRSNLYVGTGDFDGFADYGFGVMKSTDGGATFTTTGLNDFGGKAVSALVVDPESPNIITLTTGRGAGGFYGPGNVWRSTDSGATWTKVVAVNVPWSDLKIGAKDSGGKRNYYAAGWSNGGEIYRSANRGATWTKLTTPLTGDFQFSLELAASPTDPNTVYLISGVDFKLFKSVNAGASWTDITNNFPGGSNDYNWSQNYYDIALNCSTRTNGSGVAVDVIYASLIDVEQSSDGGASWRSIGGPTFSNNAITHNDQHATAVNPRDPNDVLIANDGGLYRFAYNPGTDSGALTSLNANLGITQIYHAAFHPTDPNSLLGGTQDNATPVAVGDLSNWKNVGGGDGGGVAINPLSPQTQYATSQGFNVYRTDDQWQTESYIPPPLVAADNKPFISILSIDEKTPDFVYGATDYLYRYQASTGQWTAHVGNQKLSANSVVSAIKVAPGDSNRIYTGSMDGQVWMTTDFGVTWTQINSGNPSLPRRAITSIQVSPTNPSSILVGLSGTGTGHLWACRDTTAASRVWMDVSGSGASSLPDVPLNAIALDLVSPDTTFFVGTDIGVFATKDGGATWQNATAPLGLPNVQVNDLATVAGTGYLNAATFGRGFWRIKLSLITQPATLATLTLAPTTVTGGDPATGTVTLNKPAPPSGAVVTLSSADTSVATVPASVTVAAGQTSATFTITTFPVAADSPVRIDATLDSITKSATLRVVPAVPVALTFNPNPVKGGLPTTGTVTLTGPAPTGGVTVTLSSASSVVVVPGSVTVAAGQTSADFAVTTSAVSDTTDVVVTATANGGSVSGTLSVFGIGVASLTLNPTTVRGGQTSTATVTLSDPAPAGGAVVTLTSGNTGAATVPASVTIPEGQTTTTFIVTSKPVPTSTNVTITATYNRVSQSAVLRVNPPVLTGLTLNPATVFGGQTSVGTVTLDGPAPTGNLVVRLTSDNANVATVPASVTVAAGQTSATFTVTSQPVARRTVVTITATSNGASVSALLTVRPPAIVGLSLNPDSVYGGNTSTATVTLSSAAPDGGTFVDLVSSNPAVASVPTDGLRVPAGARTATFIVRTQTVTAITPVTISGTTDKGTSDEVTVSARLNVAPASLLSLTLKPSTVAGGLPSTGTVKLSSPAGAGGALIRLSSSQPGSAAVPATVQVREGETSAVFTVTTSAVSSTRTVTITATLNGISRSAALTLTPVGLASITVKPSPVTGGQTATGMVRLNGPAPAGGLVVALASSDPSVAGVPPTLTIPQGAQSKTFPVTTRAVSTSVRVILSARRGSQTVTTVLTVAPASLVSLTLKNARVIGGSSTTGTVTLNGPAPAGGVLVRLSSNNPAAKVPASVLVPAGQTQATFTVTTSVVFSQTVVTLTASAGGVIRTATLTIAPLDLLSVTLTPPVVIGGNSSLLTVTLNGPAPPGGVLVSLSSTNMTDVILPPYLIVAAGKTSASTIIPTQPVSVETTVDITASYGGTTKTVTLTIEPPTLTAISVSPGDLKGGDPARGVVTLNGLSPGALVTVTSSNPAVAAVSDAYVPRDSTSGSFTVRTFPVKVATRVTITATYNGSSRSTTIIVRP